MSDLHPPSRFPPTRWTLLQRLRGGSEAEARAALETLCRAYLQPLYCVARRKQLSMHDAQDAVQGFFESLLRRDTFATADETAGKLRTLLLTAFDHYCTNQRQRANRQKRGAGAEHVELGEFLNCHAAEEGFLSSHNGSTSIEALYNREWATAVIERSVQALRADYQRRGWQERYDLLAGPLLQQDEDDAASLDQLAASQGVTAGALRITLHRMRGHFRDHIERELATTLDTDDPQLIREELAELFKAFQ